MLLYVTATKRFRQASTRPDNAPDAAAFTRK